MPTKKAPAVPVSERRQQLQWQAEEDLRTLRRADEIRGDRTRMNRAKTVAKQEVRALNKLTKGKR